VRYTLDGSEARNGEEYTGAITLIAEASSVYVFAESEGLEEKAVFRFAESGSKEIVIIRDKPALLQSTTPKRLDNSAKTYEGLKIAKEKSITFEQVTIMLGSAPRVIHLSMGEMKIDAEFIENELAHLQTLVPPEAPVVMQFKKAYTTTGHDLEQFAKSMGIELSIGEVIQE
jgi:hypothetical protein